MPASPRSFLPLWGEGLTVTAKKTWSPGEGLEQREAEGRRGGPQRPLPLLALSLKLSLCASVCPCVCLSVCRCLSIFVLITHHLCLSVHLSLPLCLYLCVIVYRGLCGCLSASLSLPLSDSPFAGLEAQFQGSHPDRTLKAVEAPVSEFLSCTASELCQLSAHRPAGQPCRWARLGSVLPSLGLHAAVSGARAQSVSGLGHSWRPWGAHWGRGGMNWAA